MAYKIRIDSVQEIRDLGWIGDRYESAGILFDAILDHAKGWNEDPSDQWPQTVDLPEWILWQILEATENDGGDRGRIPCLGGDLGSRIHAMLDSVV